MSIEGAGLDLARFLTYYSQRQEVIASNIANADTPGYHTQDLSLPQFSSTLREFLPASYEVSGLPAREDGNNVSLDREARLLSENNMRFNIASQLVRSELKGIRSAIEEGSK